MAQSPDPVRPAETLETPSALGESSSEHKSGAAPPVTSVSKGGTPLSPEEEINRVEQKSSSEPPRAEMHNKVENATAGKINFSENYQEVNNYFGDREALAEWFQFRRFAIWENWRIPPEKQDRLRKLFVGDTEETGRLHNRLRDQRILMLSGEAGLGKTTMAIYLSSLVSGEGIPADAGLADHETFVVPPLDRQIRVDWHGLLSESDEFQNRFVIFQNALAYGNEDLQQFISQLSEFSLAEVSASLRAKNTWLVFTTDLPELSLLQPELLGAGIHFKLHPPSNAMLTEVLDRKLDSQCIPSETSSDRLDQLRLPENRNLLIRQLRTIPRLARFIDYFLQETVLTKSDADLNEAIRRFGDISWWFQHELSSDFDAWIWTLSLGLAGYQANQEGVPWLEFEQLRRVVAHKLRRDPDLFPLPTRVSLPQSDGFADRVSLSDTYFLDKCRAEIRKDPLSLADQISFREDRYSARLWDLLLKHHRRVLATLAPRLIEIADDVADDSNLRLRILCARILGRMGEIDPERITINLVNRWMYSEDRAHRINVGALFQGGLASCDERYRLFMLGRLDALTEVQNSYGDDAHGEKNRLLTAIVVYAQVGGSNLTLAMKGLEKIIRAKLIPVMKDVQRISKLIKRSESGFADEMSVEMVIELLIYQKLLSDLAGRIFAEQRSIFAGVQLAICSLCLTNDPVIVFRELRLLMESTNQAMGALIALMFLIDEGIAARLSAQKVAVPRENAVDMDMSGCNPMIVALAMRNESVREMARFLVTIYESFSAQFIFPPEFTRHLRQAFMLNLKNWIEEALPFTLCRQAMADLVSQLMHVHRGVLSEPIYQLLYHTDFARRESEVRKEFINAVLWHVES